MLYLSGISPTIYFVLLPSKKTLNQCSNSSQILHFFFTLASVQCLLQPHLHRCLHLPSPPPIYSHLLPSVPPPSSLSIILIHTPKHSRSPTFRACKLVVCNTTIRIHYCVNASHGKFLSTFNKYAYLHSLCPAELPHRKEHT